MPRILAVIINALIGLVGFVILIWRSFPLALGRKYFFYFWDVREIRRLDFFSSISFLKVFMVSFMVWFYNISGRQLHARYFIFN
jgi:hypothetical protein